MIRRFFFRRKWLAAILLFIAVGIAYLLTTDNPHIWPARNTAIYHLTNWWEQHVGLPGSTGSGDLRGCVRDTQGSPIGGATVLVAERDGTTHTTTTSPDGCFAALTNIPAGRYVPMVGAAGYQDSAVRPLGLPLHIAAGEQQTLDVTLAPAVPSEVQPGTDLRIGAPLTRTSSLPQPSRAVRREIRFMSSGEPNQQTFLYTPITTTRHLPTLLTVYPGPVDTWEGVSVPLAAAGYAVIAIGPAYTLNLAPDVAELRRLMQFAHAGRLPGADGSQIVALGGSYSSLHVLRLLDQDARDVNLQGAVLLGPPTDLFDLRRRFEEGSFFPPYGLDQALIALGMPNTAPQRYWRYSGRYHIQADWPPLLLMHSRDDEIVPFQQTELFAAELEQAGTEYEAYFFDGMPHYLLADEYSAKLDRLYTITIDFLESRTE